jgi:hypothetical protein
MTVDFGSLHYWPIVREFHEFLRSVVTCAATLSVFPIKRRRLALQHSNMADMKPALLHVGGKNGDHSCCRILARAQEGVSGSKVSFKNIVLPAKRATCICPTRPTEMKSDRTITYSFYEEATRAALLQGVGGSSLQNC